MKARNMIYKWLLTIGLLISCEAGALAFTEATMPAAWSTTPTLSGDVQPSYQFQSTSSYALTTNTTVYEPGACSPSPSVRGARRSIWDDDPEDDTEIGQVYTPIGEPLILLLFALLYMLKGKLISLRRSRS